VSDALISCAARTAHEDDAPGPLRHEIAILAPAHARFAAHHVDHLSTGRGDGRPSIAFGWSTTVTAQSFSAAGASGRDRGRSHYDGRRGVLMSSAARAHDAHASKLPLVVGLISLFAEVEDIALLRPFHAIPKYFSTCETRAAR